jgi:hypothetical protein
MKSKKKNATSWVSAPSPKNTVISSKKEVIDAPKRGPRGSIPAGAELVI